VTAEGIETRAALDYLRDVGCDHAQGYYFARALEPDAVAAMVASSDAGAPQKGARR
jgi:EAL domain-containing protein (putative c-di-GMP-specific phosphodiesterase class I)